MKRCEHILRILRPQAIDFLADLHGPYVSVLTTIWASSGTYTFHHLFGQIIMSDHLRIHRHSYIHCWIIYIYNLLYIVSFAIFCHRLLYSDGLSPRQDELSAKDLAYTMQVAGISRDGPSIPWSVGSPRLDTPRVLRIPLSYFNSFQLRKRQKSRI